MNERTALLIGIAGAILLGAVAWFLRDREEPLVEQAPPVEAVPQEPAIKHPVPTAPVAEQAPLPPLAESDAPVQEALGGVVDQDFVARRIVPEGLVRRFVATVDALPRKKVATQVRPLRAVEGKFTVSGSEDQLMLSDENYARYEPLVRAVDAADPAKLAAVYLRFYPLMQESYEGLGYPDRYFNDRMVEVIDHLLATPEVKGPVRLTQPHVFYEYADPQLENLSAGQKALIRMGPANAGVLKKKLRAMRREITKARPDATTKQPPQTSQPPNPDEAQESPATEALPGDQAPGVPSTPTPQPDAPPPPS